MGRDSDGTRYSIMLRRNDGRQLLQANGASIDSDIIHELLKITFQEFCRQRLGIFWVKPKDLVGAGSGHPFTHGAIVAVVDDL